jgi:hypothetical protein
MFSKICFDGPSRVIWLGDLNYRIALSYSETRRLLEQYNWDTLLDKDQVPSFTLNRITLEGVVRNVKMASNILFSTDLKNKSFPYLFVRIFV